MRDGRLTQAGDEIAPELSGLPGQEEEAKEAHYDGIDSLFGYLSIHLPNLCQIRRLGCPHWRRAQTHQDASRHQGVEARKQLEGNVRHIAEHAANERPFNRQLANDQRRQEDARDNQRRIDGAQRYCAQTVLSIHRRLQVSRALNEEEIPEEQEEGYSQHDLSTITFSVVRCHSPETR